MIKKLIDKNAIIAEIEKRRDKNARNKLNLAAAFEDNYLLSFLENLDVREVNLEKEATEFVKTKEFVESKESPVLLIAKHFYELGLGTQQ